MFGPVKILEGEGLPEGTTTWPSDAHARVAAAALGFNEHVNDLDVLQGHVETLLKFTEDEIRMLTMESLRDMGLPV